MSPPHSSSCYLIAESAASYYYLTVPLVYKALEVLDSLCFIVTKDTLLKQKFSSKLLKHEGSFFTINTPQKWLIFQFPLFLQLFEDDSTRHFLPQHLIIILLPDVLRDIMDNMDTHRHTLNEMAKKGCQIVCLLPTDADAQQFEASELKRFLIPQEADTTSFQGTVHNNDDLHDRILDPSDDFFSLPKVQKLGGTHVETRDQGTNTNIWEFTSLSTQTDFPLTTTTPHTPPITPITITPQYTDYNTFPSQLAVSTPQKLPAASTFFTSPSTAIPSRVNTSSSRALSNTRKEYKPPGNPMSELNQMSQKENITFVIGEDTSDNEQVPKFGWKGMTVTDHSDGLEHSFSVPELYKSKKEAKKACAAKAHYWVFCHKDANMEIASLPLAKQFDMIQTNTSSAILQDLALYQLVLDGKAYEIGILTRPTLRTDLLPQISDLLRTASQGPLIVRSMEWVPVHTASILKNVSMTQIVQWHEWYYKMVKIAHPCVDLNLARQTPHILVPLKSGTIDREILGKDFRWCTPAPNTIEVGDLVKYTKDTSSGVLRVISTDGRASDVFPKPPYRHYSHYYLSKYGETIDTSRPIVGVENFQIPSTNHSKHLPEQYLIKLEPRHDVFEVMKILPPVLWRLHEYCLVDELYREVQAFGLTNREWLIEAITLSERDGVRNYERYETLGDTVLKFLSTCSIFLTQLNDVSTRDESKGTMELERQRLVNNDLLNKISVQRGVANYCLCRYAENDDMHEIVSGIRRKSLISDKQFADVLEALAGTIYHNVDLIKAKEFLEVWGVTPPVPRRASIQDYVRSTAHGITADINLLQKLTRSVTSVFKYSLDDDVSKLFYSSVPMDWLGDAALDLLFADHVWSEVKSPQHFTELKQKCISNDSFAGVMFLCGLLQVLPGAPIHPSTVVSQRIRETKTWFGSMKRIGDYFEKLVGCIFLDLLTKVELREAVDKLKDYVIPVWHEFLEHHKDEWRLLNDAEEAELDSITGDEYDVVDSIDSSSVKSLQ